MGSREAIRTSVTIFRPFVTNNTTLERRVSIPTRIIGGTSFDERTDGMANEQSDDAFIIWLHQAMESRRLGVRQAAKYIGIGAGMLSAYLNGETYPSLKTVRKMATYFRVPEHEILQRLPGFRDAVGPPVATDEATDPELADLMRDLGRELTPEERQGVKDFAKFVLSQKRQQKGLNSA